MRQLLTYDDVLIAPAYSDIPTRADIDIGTDFLGRRYALPIISSNMDFITEYDMAHIMTEQGAFYVVHRFMEDEALFDLFDAYIMHFGRRAWVSFSVGVRHPLEEMKKVETISKFGGGIKDDMVVTVDVAHGHHQRVADMVKQLKDFGVLYVIAGNVATADGYNFLWDAGADAVKVGIGPGAVCTTREVTGVGVPQLSAIMDIQNTRSTTTVSKSYDQWTYPLTYIEHDASGPPIIADGGIKNSGDIVKALAAGADMVMVGSLFAGTDEAPGERRVDKDGTIWRPYRGQSIFGVNAARYTPEGIEGWVKNKGPVSKVLQQLAGGIRSGLSYTGARNLTELRQKAEFVQITQATHIESGTRVATSIS